MKSITFDRFISKVEFCNPEFCEDEIFEEIPVVVDNSISTDSLMDSSVLKSVIESNDIIDFENQKYLMRHIELFSRVCGGDVVELVLKKASENRTDHSLSEAIKSDIIALEEAFIRMPNIMI